MTAEAVAPAEAEVKPRYKLAMYWASACGGCDVAVLNLGMKLIEFTERWEPVFWPAAMDAKREDVRAMEDDEIDVCLFDGGIRTDEDAEMAHLLRAKSKVLVAFGSCASEGCIPGLANQRPIEAVFSAA
ncbi:MAG: oxidoreductase, partial [Candidatus Limnocylindrales bacterium]